jgi:hypothetical protein
MKHPDAHCDCAAAATALALRWRCSVCGKTAIMKVSFLPLSVTARALER